MFRFNLFLLGLLFCFGAWPQTADKIEDKEDQNYFITSVSYFSWTEKMIFDQGPISDESRSEFSGTGLNFEKSYYKKRWGLTPEISFLSGAATGGGTSSAIIYTAPRVSFWGILLQLKADYRLSPRIIFSVGPGSLYRNVKWKNEDPTLKITSGADFNTTILGELKIRLNPNWDLRQQLGAVLFNGYTYWALGVGYRF